MISLSRLRRDLGLGSDKELVLRTLRQQVISQWEHLTRRSWSEVAGHVETIEPSGDLCSRVALSLRPVTDVTLVEELNPYDGLGWEELVLSDDYTVVGHEIYRVGAYFKPYVRVTYDGGYALDAAPESALAALVTQARFLLSRLEGDKVAISAQSFDANSTTYLDPVYHPLFAAAAEQHRRLD